MINDMNTFVCRGTVISEPKIDYEASSGEEYVSLRLRLRRRYKSDESVKVKKYDCTVLCWFFGKKRDVVYSHVEKGYELEVCGFLGALRWTDEEGRDRNSLGIVGHAATWYKAESDDEEEESVF